MTCDNAGVMGQVGLRVLHCYCARAWSRA